jgi:hypothetical protein
MTNLNSLGLLIFLPVSAQCAIVYFHTDGYRGRSDSPFLPYLEGGVTYVEDFETQGTQQPRNLLTTPNATGWNGLAVGSPGRGVQEDYSENDPSGYRWSINFSHPDTIKPPAGIHFDFIPDDQGRLPEYVGAALLGRYDPNGTGMLYNSIFVYDKDGAEVTGGEWKFVRPPFSEIPADPADYFLNFYGIYFPGGISRIHFLGFDEADHLTYGYAIPEPSSLWLTLGARIGTLRRRRSLGAANSLKG